MKLTNREKVILPMALLIIAVALFINFIYLPINKEINALKTQVSDYELQISEISAKQNAIQSLKDNITAAQQNFEKVQKDVMQEWDQPQLMAFIEETISPLCTKKSIDFFDVTPVKAIQAGEVNIVFTTDYISLKRILKKFEDAQYYNNITKFDIHESEATGTDVAVKAKQQEISMNIRFYSKNQSSGYPQKYNFMDGVYGKTNIFE